VVFTTISIIATLFVVSIGAAFIIGPLVLKTNGVPVTISFATSPLSVLLHNLHRRMGYDWGFATHWCAMFKELDLVQDSNCATSLLVNRAVDSYNDLLRVRVILGAPDSNLGARLLHQLLD
jgi:hypothetical protein